MVRYHATVAKERERPAGTLITGAATAYDPIIGAAQVRSNYNVDGTGMTVAVIDTGVDYNNSALGGSFGPGSKVIAGYDFADNSGNPDGDELAARNRRRRPDRLRQSQRSGRRAGRQYRRAARHRQFQYRPA